MTDEYTASGHHEDYARRMQNEMNRDAAPSGEEVVERQRKLECDHCGASNESLTHRPASPHYIHECPAHQAPDIRPLDLCPECYEAHDPESQHLEQLRSKDEAVVLYECGMHETAVEPEPEQVDVGGGETVDAPWSDARPMVSTECQCGASIDEVFY